MPKDDTQHSTPVVQSKTNPKPIQNQSKTTKNFFTCSSVSLLHATNQMQKFWCRQNGSQTLWSQQFLERQMLLCTSTTEMIVIIIIFVTTTVVVGTIVLLHR